LVQGSGTNLRDLNIGPVGPYDGRQAGLAVAITKDKA
jgi:hypothetical protein